MPRNRATPQESGQALVLLVLALVALIGFAALAIDGGNLYTEQRRAQAAADNAAMAAAYRQMKGTSGLLDLEAAALLNAQGNGYVNSNGTQVDFNKPPTRGPYAGNDLYVEVVITQSVPTALAHFVYGQNPIPLTVWAVAHGLSAEPLMYRFAIATMRGGCDGDSQIGLQGRGGGSSGYTHITDGGTFVNSSCPDALDIDGTNETYIMDIVNSEPPTPTLSIVGPGPGADGWDAVICTAPNTPPNCQVYPQPVNTNPLPTDPMSQYPAGTPPDALCAQLSDLSINTQRTGPGGSYQLQPGRYTDMKFGNRDAVLAPGLYCLRDAGGANDGTLSTNGANVTGSGVLIYLQNEGASIQFAGSGVINLSGVLPINTPDCENSGDSDPAICRYLGILIYKVAGSSQCLNNSQPDIDFEGSSLMDIKGLIYAPYSFVRYGGSGSLIQTGQTIAGCVKFHGNGSIDIVYNPNYSYIPPPFVAKME